MANLTDTEQTLCLGTSDYMISVYLFVMEWFDVCCFYANMNYEQYVIATGLFLMNASLITDKCVECSDNHTYI